ncbi:SRPBCC domain-containing protein [Myxococcus sp. SDU36]|uniref:SRPBCC family protein n=1 Tax=Myxococcus sp. SDU36 TaxID=2831967 RepID=UPI0025438473|nr:SRPBCC domain-containing protein [Myxococcus sp. SDU36]WIG98097.1 SRPBCC domain-containing protein [Myxococcus sp. SDU36]
MSSAQSVQVRVTRQFDASPERVFDAWLNPEMVGQWMIGASVRDEEVLRLAIDARVGGTFSFFVRRVGEELDHVGTYLEIDRPRRLVFTWHIDKEEDALSRVTVEISPRATGCELTLTHEMDAKWAEYTRQTEQGWATMMDVLIRVLAPGQVPAAP